MIDTSTLTNDELLLLSWSLIRIPSHLLNENEKTVRDTLKQKMIGEEKIRGIY